MGSLIIIWLLVAWFAPEPKEQLDDLRVQLTFLAFIVALAAYLASVTREIIKTYNQDKNPADREDRRDDLSFIETAERHLVYLGIITVMRVALRPIGLRIPVLNEIPVGYSDYFLIVYLGVIICYLGFLHDRQWKKNKEKITGKTEGQVP